MSTAKKTTDYNNCTYIKTILFRANLLIRDNCNNHFEAFTEWLKTGTVKLCNGAPRFGANSDITRLTDASQKESRQVLNFD